MAIDLSLIVETSDDDLHPIERALRHEYERGFADGLAAVVGDAKRKRWPERASEFIKRIRKLSPPASAPDGQERENGDE